MTNKAFIKLAWDARKEWNNAERMKLSKCSWEERLHLCGYYRHLRKIIKNEIPATDQYDGVALGLSLTSTIRIGHDK